MKRTRNHSDVDYLRTGGTTPLPGGAPRPAAWACKKGSNIWSQDPFQSIKNEKETCYVYQQQWYQCVLLSKPDKWSNFKKNKHHSWSNLQLRGLGMTIHAVRRHWTICFIYVYKYKSQISVSNHNLIFKMLLARENNTVNKPNTEEYYLGPHCNRSTPANSKCRTLTL